MVVSFYKHRAACLIIILSLLPCLAATAQEKPEASPPPVFLTKSGRLDYTYSKTGDRVPDFSYAGYMAGEQPVPEVPIRIVVPILPEEKDATVRIQAALDYVASLPPDLRGIRGAVLLQKGTYRIGGGLIIKGSGVVLRGSGMQNDGTLLLAEGNNRETLITIKGKDDRQINSPVSLSSSYVPVNAMWVTVASPHNFNTGDNVLIQRPSTIEWIRATGMERLGGDDAWLGWKPGYHTISWNRKITAIHNDTLMLDAPITIALDTTYQRATVAGYTWSGLITQSAVENMRCRSYYDTSNLKDENHRWMAITMENTRDSWVRRITFEHFAGSAVYVSESCRRITVEDCKSLSPVSEIAAQRRHTFFTGGEQTLFQRLYAEYGYHDFAAGYCAAGPNAFVQCESYLPFGYSGAIESWASGLLLDNMNIDGGALGFPNRGALGQGTGWTAANSVVWQCVASRIDLPAPPTATNWAFGTWARYNGNGQWFESDAYIKPASLYYAQLSDRLGKDITERALLLSREPTGTGNEAATGTKNLRGKNDVLTAMPDLQPPVQLRDWIDQLSQIRPINTDGKNSLTIDQLGYSKPPVLNKTDNAQVTHGWITRGSGVLTGSRQDVLWWRGNIRPPGIKDATSHITRFVPGRTGNGLTDDLEEVTDSMLARHVIAIDHNYGLWYERRRDDHQRVRRMDGDVWPPFYELPFARSGQGTAWDGLSKYDLTKYNPWYWSRLNRFVQLADKKGLLLIHQHYFQHNILEAGAHYADFPWRTANNINNTPFPEPPPYVGGKWIRMADRFYDTSNAAYRALHKAYIRKCLDNFADGSGVVHLISAEYTGPLHFVQFWIDVIRDWEKETGKKALIGLSATKDVQDAILADEKRSGVIDIIDIRYWNYTTEGTINAPLSGLSMAPRQYLRQQYIAPPAEKVIPGTPFQQIYRAIRDYRARYPEKAVIYCRSGADKYGWAVFMAGGSLAAIPPIEDPDFLKLASTMRPLSTPDDESLTLAAPGEAYILYTTADTAELDLSAYPSRYKISRIDPGTGCRNGSTRISKGGKKLILKNGTGKAIVFLIKATNL